MRWRNVIIINLMKERINVNVNVMSQFVVIIDCFVMIIIDCCAIIDYSIDYIFITILLNYVAIYYHYHIDVFQLAC